MRYLTLILLCFVLLAACTPEEAPERDVTPDPEGQPTAGPAEGTPVPMDPEAEETATALPDTAGGEEPYPPPTASGERAYPPPEGQEEEAGYPEPESESSAILEGCDVMIDLQFLPLLQAQAGVVEQVECPVSAGEPRQAAWQPFERGEMYWLQKEEAILVLRDGTVTTHEDPFEEGMREVPEAAPEAPSADLVQPKRGFGHTWVNMVDEMGFGVMEEKGYKATVQYFQNESILLTAPDGRILVLQGADGTGSYQAWQQTSSGEWAQVLAE